MSSVHFDNFLQFPHCCMYLADSLQLQSLTSLLELWLSGISREWTTLAEEAKLGHEQY